MFSVCSRRVAAAALLSAAGVALPAAAEVPTEWTFRIVASEADSVLPALGVPSGSQLTGSTPAIDEDGSAIARWSGLFNSSNGLVLFNASTGETTVVVSDPDQDSNTTSDFDIRNGRIGLKWFDSTIRVYDLAGNELFAYGPNGPLGTWSSPGRFTLTDDGDIGVIASLMGVRSLIIDENATPPRMQTLVAQQTAPITFLAAPFMNQNRQFGGPAHEGSVFTVQRFEAGQPPVTLFTTAVSTEYNNIANQSDINDLGHVAFFVRRVDASSPDGVTWELRKGTGPNTSELLVDDNNPELVPADFINFNPDIANNGLVAFRARWAGGTAVFMTDGTTVRRVAGAGDSIITDLGEQFITAVPGGVSQNEANQLAFHADLASGATVLIVATPVGPACPGDFNGSGAISVQDIFDFLAAYFANDPRADFNQAGGITVQDIFDFLVAYFAGC